MDYNELAGMIAVIARHGQIAHLQCFGRMDVEAGKPMAAGLANHGWSVRELPASPGYHLFRRPRLPTPAVVGDGIGLMGQRLLEQLLTGT